MSGTSMVRHCTVCSRDVYNLSMLTEREAQAALAVRPEEVCVRYFVDGTDQIIFYPEPERAERPHRAAVAAALAASLISASACSPTPEPPTLVAQAPAPEQPTPVAQAPVPEPANANVVAPATSVRAADQDNHDTSWAKAFEKQRTTDKHVRRRHKVTGRPAPKRHEHALDDDPLMGSL